ncbi:MAG: hypothetical protein CVU88_04165 [Firmicutes bacterium HGW-Firmicutes-13]|nr:MAG: hypothetical protein CVU88_04165 [Firmicutes bacterium HGW-Firmicutes-13]
MNGLIIFVLFIVFSIIRRFLEQGKQLPLPAPGGSKKGLPPLEPVPRRIPVERKRTSLDIKSNYSETRLKKTPLSNEISTLIEENGVPAAVERRDIPKDEFFSPLKLSPDNLVGGIIMSEVLGPPRSRKPFRTKQLNKLY